MNNNFQFTKKMPSSAPEIKETTISLNAEDDVSSGKFETILNSGVLFRRRPVASLIVNVPIFQLSVNLNPQNKPSRCVVLIGKPIENFPRDKKTFLISDEIINDITTEHKVLVCWNNWNIIELRINEKVIAESNIFNR